MSLTRRDFSHAAGVGVALSLLGCDRRISQTAEAAPAAGGGGPSGGKNKGLAKEPFLAGAPAAYAKKGLYDAYKKDYGVWLVSDGQRLVALSATCTHTGCSTAWDADKSQYVCPCHKSRFELAGENIEGGKAKRPLERCALSLVDADGGKQVRVDPTRRFRKEAGEWSKPESSLALS